MMNHPQSLSKYQKKFPPREIICNGIDHPVCEISFDETAYEMLQLVAPLFEESSLLGIRYVWYQCDEKLRHSMLTRVVTV